MSEAHMLGKIKRLSAQLAAAEGPDPQDALDPERVEEIRDEIEWLEYALGNAADIRRKGEQ